MTNNELYELFCEHNIRSYCKGTYAPRNSYVKCHFLPKNGYKDIQDITPADIEQMYDDMSAEGLRQNSVFGAYSAISAYFTFAINKGQINYNPVRAARTVKKEQ